MANNVPGSFKKELDKSLTISATDTVAGAIVIKSPKGRINTPITVSNEAEFIEEFGKPVFSGKSKVPEYGYGMYAALKYLSISDKITIVRVPSVTVSGTDITEADEYAVGGLKYESNALSPVYYTNEEGVAPYKEDDATSYSSPVVPNTPTRIIDLDNATAIADSKFSIFFSAPGAEGNNIAYSIEFFGGNSDWKYNYDPDSNVDTVISKIKDGTATTDDITSIIATQVFKLSFYSKNSSENWPTNFTNGSIKPDKVIYASLNNILDANKESLYIGDKIEMMNSLYFIENETLTNQELLDIVKRGFDDTVLIEGQTDFSDAEDFMPIDDSYSYVSSMVDDEYYYIAKPKTEAADASNTSSIDSSSVERLIASSNMEVRYKAQSDGSEGFYIRPVGSTTEGTTRYVEDTNGNLANESDANDILLYADGTPIKLPFKELVIESKPDSEQPGEFVFIALKGGNNSETGTSDINNIQGWSYLANRESVDANIILVPSPKTTVKQHVASHVIDVRKDCVMEAQSGSIDNLDADSIIAAESYGYSSPSFVSLTAGFTKVKDSYNDKFVWLPNSIFAAYTDAKTAIEANVWDSPAGNPRGIISGIEQLVTFSEGDLSKLFAANINAAKMFAGVGSVIWESLTALRQHTALRSKSVRFNINNIENTLEEYTNSLVHNINNTETERTRIELKFDKFLSGIKNAGGLYDYKVQCDDENNTPEVIDNEELVIWVFLKPVRNVKFIKLTYVITDSGASFDEIQV